MNWRGTTEIQDRLFAALPYALPLITGLRFGSALLSQFGFLQLIYAPLIPLIQLYRIPLVPLIIFFTLIFAVVRNENIPRFIRFNTMQAVMLNILLIVLSFIFSILNLSPSPQDPQVLSLLEKTLFNTIFLGALATCLYSIVQTARGVYAEIPALSEAVNGQVR